MAKVDFKLDDVKLKANLARVGPQINKYMTLTTDFAGVEGETQMKTKAPWTDRTTNARNGLNHKTTHSGVGPIGFTEHSITFAHGVDYGIWLEVANSGQYQIIMPTVVAVGQECMKQLGALFAAMDGRPSPKPRVDLPTFTQRGTSQEDSQRTQRTVNHRNTKHTKTTNRTRRT